MKQILSLNLLFLFAILQTCLLVRSDPAYARDTQYIKLDATGKELPPGTAEWVMVTDSKTGLTWEVKGAEESSGEKGQIYKWSQAKTYVDELNSKSFGGFTDWRIPNKEELQTIREKKEQAPLIDTDFFPYTASETYWSWYICGDGSFITDKLNFGTEKKRLKGHHIRAVRGNKLY